MADTMLTMPRKTVQVRIPDDLAQDVAIVAAAFDQSVPEYVEQVLRDATKRDLQRAAKIAVTRAESRSGTKRAQPES